MLKTAVVGSGRMGGIYATLLSERTDTTLVAIVGNTKEKAQDLGSRLKTKVYLDGDVDGLLKDHPDLDAIVIATPEWVHLSDLKKLIPTGKKLLIEKPLVVTGDELAEVEKLAIDYKKNLSVVHSLRFSPRFSQTKKALEQKQIGEIRHLYARRNGCLRTVKRVLGKMPLAYWLTCHDIDLMRWFTGSEVEWVLASTRGKLQSEDDYLIVHLHFKNGVDAVEEISWCSPSLSSTAPGCAFSIKGTQGSLEVDDNDRSVSIFQSGDKASSPDLSEFYEVFGTHYGTLANMMDAWVKSLNSKETRFPVSFDEGAQAIRVCGLIDESVRTGKIVYAK